MLIFWEPSLKASPFYEEANDLTQQELEEQLAALDAFVRELYETVGNMNTRLHQVAHKLIEVELRIDSQPPTPFRFPR